MSAARNPTPTAPAEPDIGKPVAGVIFDFDGTLGELHIDFAEMRRQALAVMERHGVDPASLPQTFTLEQLAAAGEALKEKGQAERAQAMRQEAMQAIENIEVKAACRARLFECVAPTLEALRGLGVACVIVTRNCARAVDLVLGEARRHFRAVLTREAVANVKPHPEHLQSARKALGVADGAPVMMVGDHPSDMQAARAAGMIAVGVLSGSASAQALAEAGAHFLVPDVGGVPALVHAWNLCAATRQRFPQAARGVNLPAEGMSDPCAK